MADSSVKVPNLSSGVEIDNTLINRGGHSIFRQRVETYTANTFGDLTADAWGVQKMSLPHSLFHGLFTFDIPPSQWFMYENGAQVYTSTNIISTNGEGIVSADATKTLCVLESRQTPRYQPNRGHLYSTALWCPNKTNDGIREWGVGTAENTTLFRLKGDGKLYAVQESGGVQRYEQEIDTSILGDTFTVESGNVYDIQYQWRGVGNYKFFINLVLVHEFNHLGTLTELSMEDPALPARFAAQRITEDVEIHIGCVDITSENGDDDRLHYGSVYAAQSRNGTNLPLLCIYNPLQINGKTNTRMIELSRITLLSDKKTVFRVWSTRDPSAIVGATFVARGNGSFVQTDSSDANPTAVPATSVDTTKMVLITVITVQANISTETNNPFQNRIDFPVVRGDYLVITATASTASCECIAEWGEAI